MCEQVAASGNTLILYSACTGHYIVSCSYHSKEHTDCKSPDALMRHLRDNGISISGSSQKQQLINTGYFHGYK